VTWETTFVNFCSGNTALQQRKSPTGQEAIDGHNGVPAIYPQTGSRTLLHSSPVSLLLLVLVPVLLMSWKTPRTVLLVTANDPAVA
jgi:hypothetical protein